MSKFISISSAATESSDLNSHVHPDSATNQRRPTPVQEFNSHADYHEQEKETLCGYD